MKTILDINPSKEEFESLNYNFQEILTPKLDSCQGIFDQNVINEVVLWKTNRYVKASEELLELINNIKVSETKIDTSLTFLVLEKLLLTHGVRLPMASSILRFRNPSIYQIIDQRVYRIITGEELKIPSKIPDQIEFYLKYLTLLSAACIDFNVPFKEADRLFYELDKKHNKSVKIKY